MAVIILSLGEFYMEIVILLMERIFINGTLMKAEIWYNLTKEEIKELENLDLTLLRKVMRVPFSTPIEAYYL